MALALAASIASCSSASVINAGGGQSGSAGSGAGGAGGVGGGLVVRLDARPSADTAADRPSGGTCGDGVVERSEECDDSNTANGDGCSRLCQVEASWLCPTEGKACTYAGTCGNGVLTPNKVCDDGNTTGGDGCSGDCRTVEPGYLCRVPGKPCAPQCGDGTIKGFESCDDGNTDGEDGCSSTCKVEPGFECSGSPSSCKPTVCGNGAVEEGEGCDDGNDVPFDGCSPTCQADPKCGTSTSAVGACRTVCGDGIVLRGIEACDDGNVRDGDGCSHDCKTEPGFTCVTAYDDPPPSLTIPIVVRDFEGYQKTGDGPNDYTGHGDFGHYCCNEVKGVTQSTLGADRKPVYTGTDAAPLSMTTGKTAFDQWYRDVKGINQTFHQTLTLKRTAAGTTTYSMDSDTDDPWFDRCGFFPLDSKPLIDQNTGKVQTYTDSAFPGRTCTAYEGLGFGRGWANHNYLFSSELRYWFQYQGNENLKFTGDDDVWVFVNGTLAVDLGGVHNRAAATVILDANDGSGQIGYGEPPGTYSKIDFKLTKGSVYEVVVFQAERWCCGSNYMLTLANFLAGKSQCVPTCGDGVAVADEECDCGDGSTSAPAGCPGPNDDATYGGCTTQCKWGPFCGDGVTQGPEQCDRGEANGKTGEGTPCSIACKSPRTCGNGTVDSDLGEECDLGPKNGLKLDGQLQPVSDPSDPEGQLFCTTDCKIPPGIVY